MVHSQAHERELSSIRPINSFGAPVGNVPGGVAQGSRAAGGQGSIVDKASARDLLRADVSPMDIDPRITFESIGGAKVLCTAPASRLSPEPAGVATFCASDCGSLIALRAAVVTPVTAMRGAHDTLRQDVSSKVAGVQRSGVKQYGVCY